MSKENVNVNFGCAPGLCGLVFLIFLFLKLAGIGVVATWSWWWVTAPLWLPTVAVIAVFLIVYIVYAIAKAVL